MTTGMRIPPQDIESERALLGAIMLKQNAMYEVADVISADSFYAAKHKTIYESMLALFEKGEPIDLVSLSGKLKERKKLDYIGGRAYLSELVSTAPAATNASHYAQVTKAKHILRDLIAAADHIGELGYAEEREVEHVLDEAQSRVFEIASTSSLQKFTTMKEVAEEAWDRLQKLKDGEGLRGVPTGFSNLDNKLAGFQKSDLIILAARPSVGKTALALDIARQSALQNKTRVAIFSLEMSKHQLADRMISAQSGVDAWKLRNPNKYIKEEDELKIRRAAEELSEAVISIDDKVGNTVLQMRSIARRMKSENGLDLIIIDYLQLITPGATRSSDSMVQQVTEISRALKGMARELNVPVLALSQLSRAVEQRGGKPRLSDLRDSGSIEQDADVVMFLHRDREEKQNEEFDNGHTSFDQKESETFVIIAKHRNGPVGEIKLTFDPERATYKYIPQDTSDYGGAIEETQVEEF